MPIAFTFGSVICDEFELVLQERGSSQRRVLLQQMQMNELGDSLDGNVGRPRLNRLQDRVVSEHVLLLSLY